MSTVYESIVTGPTEAIEDTKGKEKQPSSGKVEGDDTANDEDVCSLSRRLIKENRESYEALSK